MRVYSLGPAGRGAIAGAALVSPLKSLVAPGWTAPGLGAEGGFDAVPPEIICVSSPAGLGEVGAGRAGATEPLKSCVNPPGAESVAGGATGGAAAGCAAIGAVLKSSVKPPPASELEKGVGVAFGFAAAAAASVLKSSVNRPVPGWADKGDSGA